MINVIKWVFPITEGVLLLRANTTTKRLNSKLRIFCHTVASYHWWPGKVSFTKPVYTLCFAHHGLASLNKHFIRSENAQDSVGDWMQSKPQTKYDFKPHPHSSWSDQAKQFFVNARLSYMLQWEPRWLLQSCRKSLKASTFKLSLLCLFSG